MLLHGAIHRPEHPVALSATSYRVGAPRIQSPNWFADCPADGDILLNDQLSCCVEDADFRLIQVWKSLKGIAWRVPVDLVMLRYEAVAGWSGVIPGNDPGSVTQVDCFAWQAVPILDDAGTAYSVTWQTVPVAQMAAALREGPLLGTIGLTEANQDDPDTWHLAPTGPFVDYHRVLVGSWNEGLYTSRSYGLDYPVHPSMFVGADLMLTA